MFEQEIHSEEEQQSHTERKTLARLFVFCAVVAVTMLGMQLYGTLFRTPALILKPATPEEDPNAALKAKDTDGDGLSDYDETYLYHTSPYLKDSDSDGVDDRTEILQGTDPNCPEGKACGASDPIAAPKPEDLGVTKPTASEDALAGMQNLLNMKPAEIRSMLIKGGMAKTNVDKLSDADIMNLYQKAILGATETVPAPKDATQDAATAAPATNQTQTTP